MSNGVLGKGGGEMAQQLGTPATFAEDPRVQFRARMSENSKWPVTPAPGEYDGLFRHLHICLFVRLTLSLSSSFSHTYILSVSHT